jgi:Mlc titration factor MtfA (ptsG expression regulator)
MSRLSQILLRVLSRYPLGSRVRLPTDPIPSAWPGLVASQVPLVSRLPPPDRERLYRLMQLFLKEVPLEGCGGLEISEEIRVTIAAEACLLLLRMPYPRYTRVRRVLVYPSSFVPRTVPSLVSGQVVRPDVPLRGQAWQSGIVVLGWDSVRRDTHSPSDGENVVLHEFAHMLDGEDGSMDGIPVLDSSSAYRAWAALLSVQFAEHVAHAQRGEPTTLNPYGAENRAEFFAVATEAFFENPVELRKGQPDLYALLTDFFKLDPASLAGPPDATGPPDTEEDPSP